MRALSFNLDCCPRACHQPQQQGIRGCERAPPFLFLTRRTKNVSKKIDHQGLRIGLYDPLKRSIADATGADGDGLGLKVVSGLATGALAICVASPTDLVKVRMQAEGKLPPGAVRRYPSALGAYAAIVRTEGLRALWTGLGPNVARNAIINAAELASYDAIKQRILAVPGVEDGVPVHLASGLGAGFFAVVCGSPGEKKERERNVFFPRDPLTRALPLLSLSSLLLFLLRLSHEMLPLSLFSFFPIKIQQST